MIGKVVHTDHQKHISVLIFYEPNVWSVTTEQGGFVIYNYKLCILNIMNLMYKISEAIYQIVYTEAATDW